MANYMELEKYQGRECSMDYFSEMREGRPH